jgi:hypothetical protein
LLAKWQCLASQGLVALAASVLLDHFDMLHAEGVAQRLCSPNGLVPLLADSLAPARLADALRAWHPLASAA